MRFLKPLNGVLSCLTTREDASCEVASIYWFAQRLAMAHQIHPNLSFVSAEFVGGSEPDTRMHRRKDEPAVKQEVGSLARCVGGHPTFESSMSFPGSRSGFLSPLEKHFGCSNQAPRNAFHCWGSFVCVKIGPQKHWQTILWINMDKLPRPLCAVTGMVEKIILFCEKLRFTKSLTT